MRTWVIAVIIVLPFILAIILITLVTRDELRLTRECRADGRKEYECRR